MQYPTFTLRCAISASLALGLYSTTAVADGPQCELTVQSDWGSGYQASVTVTNLSDSALSQWSVPLKLPEGHSMGSLWSADYDPVESVAANVSWNGSLAPGASTQFGFIGQYQGDFEPPECDVGETDPEPEPEPELDFDVSINGRSVFVEIHPTSIASIEGLEHIESVEDLEHSIEFDRFKTIAAPAAWHTFHWDDDFRITVSVRGDGVDLTETQTITVADAEVDNNPPRANLYLTSSGGSGSVYTGLSYDPDGDELDKSLDRYITEQSDALDSRYHYYALTVFDGELGDTTARGIARGGEIWYDDQPYPAFTYSLDGQALTVNGGASRNAIELDWDFDDQSSPVSAVHYTHVYEQPGQYEVTLYTTGYPHRLSQSHTVNVGNGLNNPPFVGLECWERTTDGEEYWVDCYPVGTLDPDGDDLTLTWTMGDGAEYTTDSADEPVRHHYAESGYYDVSLSVTDGSDVVQSETSVSVAHPSMD